MIGIGPKKARKFKSWSDEAHEMWCNLGVADANMEAAKAAYTQGTIIDEEYYEELVLKFPSLRPLR